MRLDSNKKLVNYASMIGFYDLRLDYLDQFPKKIAEVTMEDVIDAFRRRVKLQKLILLFQHSKKLVPLLVLQNVLRH